MIIKQLSVFLENKSGRLTEVFETLASSKVNITAATVADTSEYGILRLIVSDPEESKKILKEKGFTVNISDVLSIISPTKAESISKVLKILSDENISIEYIYAFSHNEQAILIIKTDSIARTIDILQLHKMELLKAHDLYKL